MKQECLVVAATKRRRYGSYQGEISPAPDNLINRDFEAATPNRKWLTDITEFQIPAGKVCLSPLIDCFDGLVIIWSIGTRPDADLVNTMLDAAIEKVATLLTLLMCMAFQLAAWVYVAPTGVSCGVNPCGS